MSASVASKNLYELLGNDPPEEPQPSKAPRQVIKNTTTSKKRDEKETVAPAATAGRGSGRGPRRPQGNEGAFRDREAGSTANRMKNTGDNGAPARGRGGRGGRGGRREFERRDATGKDEHEKQANLAWGSNEGNSEWNDELAGAEIAQKELTDAAPDVAAEVTDTPEEEETKTKTYDEYKAELAARQAELGRPTEIRKPNEGARNDKKWAAAKELSKEEEAAYFAGESKDKTRTRERKTKQFVEVETRFVEPRENRPRGGGERGERGGRGGRGDRGDRPRGGRGGDRGDRSAPRGGDRAPRGDRRPARAPGAPVNVKDEAAFPSLGA